MVAFGVVGAALLALMQAATNFSGQWSVSQAARNGRGNVTILNITQIGSKVTGTFGSRGDGGGASPANVEIYAGQAEGDTLSFYVWRGSDVPVKQYYKGTMHGDEITFTVTGGPPQGGFGPGGGAGAAPAPLTAKRLAN